MANRRLSIKFYRRDRTTAAEPDWRWFDAITPPRLGDFVLQPGSTDAYKVLAVTWAEVDEVNVTIERLSTIEAAR